MWASTLTTPEDTAYLFCSTHKSQIHLPAAPGMHCGAVCVQVAAAHPGDNWDAGRAHRQWHAGRGGLKSLRKDNVPPGPRSECECCPGCHATACGVTRAAPHKLHTDSCCQPWTAPDAALLHSQGCARQHSSSQGDEHTLDLPRCRSLAPLPMHTEYCECL